jgi:hypothetical protein
LPLRLDTARCFERVPGAHLSCMRRSPFLILGALLLSLSHGSSTAWADPAEFSPWLGSYKAVAPSQAKDTIEHAIEKSTSSMGLLRRSVARSRLEKTNSPYKVVRIANAGDEVVTDFDGRRYSAPSDGSPEKGKDPEGKKVTVSFRAEGSTLRGRYVGEDGEKLIDFERSPDGQQLTVHVTVLSKKLPEPIHYSMRYAKQ